MAVNPLFTIIIPTANRAELLRRAIESVLKQHCENWEICIVDDGSTDPTQEVVKSFTDPRIHYSFQQHQERSVARNKGIEMAKGQYLCFLDDDDYFFPEHLELLEQSIKKEAYPVAVFRTGMLIERQGQLTKTPNFDPEHFSNPVLFFLKNMAGIHTLCFHQKIIQTFSFDPRWFHFQDTHLLVRALLEFPFYQLDIYTCVYVRYPGMGSISVFKRADAEQRTANNVAAIKDLFVQGGEKLNHLLPPNMEAYLVCQKYLDHANGALSAGKIKLSWKLFKTSWKKNKGRWFYWRYCKLFFKILLKRFIP